MPCTACGSSGRNKKTFELNKPKRNTNNKVVYLTLQQIAALRTRKQSSRRTLVFN
jgi:hypothetical protein